MSNTYTNQILFGHSKTQVNEEYIRNLLPLMLTEERLKECIAKTQYDETHEPLVKKPLPLVEKDRYETPLPLVEKERNETTHRPSSPPTASGIGSIPERGTSVGIGRFSGETTSVPAPKGTCGSTRAQAEFRSENARKRNCTELGRTPDSTKCRCPWEREVFDDSTEKRSMSFVDRIQRSLFWSIYELQHPEEAFLQTRANTEIEYRIKVIDALKKTPKRLKETNSKLTLEQTQAIFGAMLTAKEDRIDFCIAYAAYHNKPILVVYSKSYTVFSPTVEVDLSDIDDVIVIYASQSQSGKKSVFYTPERNLTQDVLQQITETKVAGPLKSMSTYKNPELDEIASKLQIATRTSESDKKEKRRKKEDIYNDIRVAIHDDMNMNMNWK